MAPVLSIVVGNLVPGTLPSQGPHPHTPSKAPQKLFVCRQVRNIPGLFTCLKVFSRHGFLKQNAFVLPNIPYVCVSRSVMSNSVTPWTIGCQALLSMEFSRQEYWSGLQFPSPGDLPNPGIEPESPALQADSLLSVPPEKSKNTRGVAYPFSRGSSQPRNLTRVSYIAGGFFTS